MLNFMLKNKYYIHTMAIWGCNRKTRWVLIKISYHIPNLKSVFKFKIQKNEIPKETQREH